ncbi:mutS protein homolog 4-like [Orussus abietinus]|uniref:mutS protein homolog 4-like n=1 Tax=Orussus abietinus TaxID=222816 RepID=UPI000C71600C|nr:mutS protein homolog 4-like [Orussus abietinus]
MNVQQNVDCFHFDAGFRMPLVNFGTNSAGFKTPQPGRRGRGTSSSSAIFSSGRSGTHITSSSSKTSSLSESCNVIAITAGRGHARGEVGIAAIDVRRPDMVLCQISDRQTYADTISKIYFFQPVEILMPDTMCPQRNSGSKLYETIVNNFVSVNITPIPRKHFSDKSGLDRVKTLCAKDYASVLLVIDNKYYALAAAAALLKYVEFIQRILYVPKAMKIQFQGPQNATVIDMESARSLELVTSLANLPFYSLLGILDKCSTPAGRRLLRASILQPPCIKEVIEGRQECVAELVSKVSLLCSLREALTRLGGADRILDISSQNMETDNVKNAERNLNTVLLLKSTLEALTELRSSLETGDARFFQQVRQNLRDPRFQLIHERILKVIHPEAKSLMGFTSASIQRCFSIRAGISDLLDVARQTYCELIDQMKKMIDDLAEKFRLPLELSCSASLGYHVRMDSPRGSNFKASDLPPIFTEVQKKRNTFYMTTEFLLALGRHCIDACDELHVMSNVLLFETICDIRPHVGCLFQLAADVAELDLIQSLAQSSTSAFYVRPSFGPELRLKDSKHPIMTVLGFDSTVPNDVEASIRHNFCLITGPNKSGKTIYLKQIVLLHIMAQIGCYVPAYEAQFRIADRMLCGMCSADNTQFHGSSFAVEMKTADYILQSLTPSTLIVLDELGRSTAVDEGTSIAWTICEQLLNSPAFTFCATHFLYMTKLEKLYPNVTNNYFETLSETKSSQEMHLTYTHKLMKGVVALKNYGMAAAYFCDLPSTLYDTAKEILPKVEEIKKQHSPEEDSPRRLEAKGDCYERLKKLLHLLSLDPMPKEVLLKVFQGLQLDNVEVPGKSSTPKSSSDERERAKEPSVQSFVSDTSKNAPSSSSSQIEKQELVISKRRLVDSSTPSDFEDIVGKRPAFVLSPLPEHFDSNSIVIPSSPNFMDQLDRNQAISELSQLSDDSRTMSNLSLRSGRTLSQMSFKTDRPTYSRKMQKGFDIMSNFMKEKQSGASVCSTLSLTSSIFAPSRSISNQSPFRQDLSRPGTSTQWDAFRISNPMPLEQVTDVTSFPGSIFSLDTQDSMDARIRARCAEAEIFRMIEGDDFDEQEFLGSIPTDRNLN